MHAKDTILNMTKPIEETVVDVEGGDSLTAGAESKLSRNESMLEGHTDPFAPREGKTLVWKNVNMTLVRW